MPALSDSNHCPWWQRPIFWIVVLGIIHGLLMVFVMPPWQHYDEPTHFEYAWLIAHNLRLPEPGDVSASMRREVAASMVEHGFFDNLDFKPHLLGKPHEIWLGISQLADPPGYYLVASLPLLFFPFLDVTTQLTLARLVSLGLYALTLVCGYGIARELTPANHPLQWLVPLTMALLATFTDLMTAVNNDVGATLAFSIFLWIGVRIVRHGLNLKRLAALSLISLLCLFVKSNVWIAIPLAAGLLLFMASHSIRLRWVVWAGTVTIMGLALVGALNWGDAARWYRHTTAPDADEPTRQRMASAPLGDHALVIPIQNAQETPLTLYQPLSPSQVAQLQGRSVTLAGWAWADALTQIDSPALWVDRQVKTKRLQVTTLPQFWAFQASIPQGASQIQIVVNPGFAEGEEATHLYLDGITLVKGRRPLDQTPVFDGSQASSGTWGGQPIHNLARNASYESAWVTLKPRWDSWLRRNTSIHLNRALSALQDYSTFGWVFRWSAVNLFESFWGRFGWNHISIPRPWYLLGFFLSVSGLAGTLYRLAHRWKHWPSAYKAALAWLASAAIVIWLQALTRMAFPVWGQRLFLPSARYAYPAIVPTVLALTAGWTVFVKRPPATRLWLALWVLALITLDLVSILTIIRFYSSA